MKYHKFVIKIVLIISVFVFVGCNKNGNNKSRTVSHIKSQEIKFETPLTLKMSYTTTNNGNYYILAILLSKESTPYASFEVDVSEEFIIKGNKKWSGEIERNIPKIIEIEVLKEFKGKEIIGVFTASINGGIFTVNEILNLKKIEKPSQDIFQEKKNERGEKIADYKVTK